MSTTCVITSYSIHYTKLYEPRPERARKLSFKEKQELAALPGTIEALESEQAELHQRLADPDLYRQEGPEVARLSARLDELESLLNASSYNFV